MRFVGKHSKDGCLSIYVQKRNLIEYDGANGQLECEPLGCIVRIKRESARDMEIRGQVAVVGVLARFVCDFGLQYTEHALYQVETQLYPLPPASGDEGPAGGVFDMSTRFVTSLPDEWHFPLLLRLPAQLPPSVSIRAAGSTIPLTTWGLTWYVFAYVANAQAVRNTLQRHGVNGAWPRLRIGRRHSKVFLSFGKTCLNSVERICRSLPPPTGTSKRRSFLSGSAGSPLLLEASLDRAAYRSTDQIQVSIRLRNNGRRRVNSIRITMKQLLTVKYANDPRQTIKTTVGEFEVSEVYRGETSFDTTFPIDLGRLSLYGKGQIALAAHLPRRDDLPSILASSTAFAGMEWRGGSFGLERLRLFSIEYYLNVHAVIPWASDVIVKLPFHMVSGVPSEASSGNSLAAAAAAAPLATPSAPPSSSLSAADGGGAPRSSVDFFDRFKPLAAPQIVRGNLITLDEPAGDEEYEGGDEGDMEENQLPWSVGEMAPRARTGTSLGDPIAEMGGGTSGDGGLSWLEDLKIARDTIDGLRGKISAAHRQALDNPLDSRTLMLECASRRKRIIREFLEHVNSLVTKDVPRVRMLIAKVGGSHENQIKPQSPLNSFVAQATATRLGALGVAHAALVPLSHNKEGREGRLELFSRVVDDFDLFLARAERGAVQDALGILDRMSFVASSGLIRDIPGWPIVAEAFKLLRQTIIRGGYAGRGSAVQEEEAEVMMQRAALEEPILPEFDAENEKDDLISAMADQFQQVLLAQIGIGRDEGTSGDFALPRELLIYCTRLEALLLSDLPRECLGPVAFFHWRFLLALAEYYFIGTVGDPTGPTLMLDSFSLKWSPPVESTVPARFLLKRQDPNELEETAQQIVTFMQQL